MDNVDEFFHGSHYNIIRMLLGVTGLWPYHTLARRCAVYIGIVLILGSGFTFEVLGMIEVWHDTFELVDCLPLLFLAIVVYIKLISAVYTLPKIKILLIKMHEYCLSPKSNEEIKIQHSHTLYGRKLGYAYTGLLLSHSAAFIFTTFLTKFIHTQSADTSSKAKGAQEGVPYRVNYMVDLDTYYALIFLHTATCEVSYMILLVTFDVLYLTLVEHCCGLFAALRYRFENAFELEQYENGPTTASMRDRSYSNIVYSVRRHAEATQFVALMESVHSLPLLVHVGAVVLVLSVVGFQVMTNTESINHLLKHTTYLNGLIFNIFFENWQGQKIVDSSEKVYESVYVLHNVESAFAKSYNANWYDMPIAAQKLLVLAMMKSKRPSEITAGKIIVMSFVTFNAVLRASSSYFMLLRSL